MNLPLITAIITVAALLVTNSTSIAQSPSLPKETTKTELIRDVQSPDGDEARLNAIKLAVQRHDIDVLTAGIVCTRLDVRKLCLENLNSFLDDQQKSALRACLLSRDVWQRDYSGPGGAGQFVVNRVLVDRLKYFGIVVQPYELWQQATREAIVQRLQ